MAAKTQEQLEGELQRVKEGRVWSAVHEEQATRVRVEAQRDELKAEVVRLNEQVNSRSRKHAANMDELYTLRGEVKSLQKLNAVYDVKAQRKFFEVDPILEQKADLKRQVESLRQQLKAEQEQTAKYKAIAEPPKEKFFVAGHYTADVDLSALEMIASLGVSPNVAPALFVNFADFYGIKLPSREKKVCTGTDPATGERVYEVKDVLFIPGKTHMKELPAIGGELHKMQVAEWLLDDPEANYCYVADGANSQQKEILAQLLYRRNKETGKLESMAMSIDEIPDKRRQWGSTPSSPRRSRPSPRRGTRPQSSGCSMTAGSLQRRREQREQRGSRRRRTSTSSGARRCARRCAPRSPS